MKVEVIVQLRKHHPYNTYEQFYLLNYRTLANNIIKHELEN